MGVCFGLELAAETDNARYRFQYDGRLQRSMETGKILPFRHVTIAHRSRSRHAYGNL